MREERIASRYGRAVFMCVSDEQVLVTVQKELSLLAEAMSSPDSELRTLLLNPAFSKEERSKVVTEFASVFKLSELTKNLVLLLIEKGRSVLLPLIAKEFSDDVDRQLGRVRANICSAKGLSEEELHEIVEALKKRSGKNVIADVKVDAAAALGVRAQIGGLIFDGTLSTMLDRFKRKLIEAPVN